MTTVTTDRETPTLAQRLASFAAETFADGPPTDVVASVRQRVLDVLGLCVAPQIDVACWPCSK